MLCACMSKKLILCLECRAGVVVSILQRQCQSLLCLGVDPGYRVSTAFGRGGGIGRLNWLGLGRVSDR